MKLLEISKQIVKKIPEATFKVNVVIFFEYDKPMDIALLHDDQLDVSKQTANKPVVKEAHRVMKQLMKEARADIRYEIISYNTDEHELRALCVGTAENLWKFWRYVSPDTNRYTKRDFEERLLKPW